FVDPASSFNAAQYVEGANAAIEDILARGRIAIVEGGTMLYVDALTKGFSLTGVPPDPELRSKLERMDLDSLRARLLALDPDPGVDLRNPVRMVRAVEVLEVAGAPLRRLRGRTPPPWRAIHIGLTAPFAVIDARIEKRSGGAEFRPISSLRSTARFRRRSAPGWTSSRWASATPTCQRQAGSSTCSRRLRRIRTTTAIRRTSVWPSCDPQSQVGTGSDSASRSTRRPRSCRPWAPRTGSAMGHWPWPTRS